MVTTIGQPAKALPLRGFIVVTAVFLALIAGIAWSSSASAHAALDSSDPAANAVLADTPARVTMRFTEPLEKVARTKAALFDQVGQLVQGPTYELDDNDQYVMVLVIPDALPHGTYSVVWQTLSAADGHPASGYIPFTVGTVDDVRSVVPPDLGSSSGPPEWLRTFARWISYLGVALVVAAWPIWLLVLRPAISPAWQAGPRFVRRVRAIAYAGVLIALFGSLLALYVQVDSADDGAGFFSTVWTMLSDTRYGRIWIFRAALLVATGVAFMGAAWWWPRRQRVASAGLLGLVLLVPVPFALTSHASAQIEGRTTAMAVDYLHLFSASLWAGGLIYLVLGLLPTLRYLTAAGRRVVLQRAVPRFSAVALASWAVILLSGFFAGWLQVGGLRPLRETAYGTSLTIKLLLIVPILILAAFNLLVVSRHLKRDKTDDESERWGRRFAITVTAEVVLVIAVLLVAGRLTTQQPAREALAQQANQIDVAFDLQGRPSTLSLAPGTPGPNHFRLDVGGDALPGDTEAVLRLTVPSLDAGQNELALERTTGNAFEAHGSDVSVAGDYSVQVIVRQIGGFQLTSTISLPIEQAASSDGPAAAWKFSGGGVLGLLLIVIGLAACAFAWWTGRGPLRKEAWGIGAVAIALGALLLLQARVSDASSGETQSTGNPVVSDSASIERGKAVYEANCIQCHGAAGKGDGPAAAALDPPPADLASPHAAMHLDEELFDWIANGISGSSMPAFSGTLTDEQIWDVVNYIRTFQPVSTTPTPTSGQ